MTIPTIFKQEVTNSIIERINTLTATTSAVWGKMDVAQMLAHCSVTYDMIYSPEKFPQPNFFVKFMLKTFVKKIVVGEGSYKKSSQTAPAFLITDVRNFEAEKSRLIDFILKTQALGENHFDNKESHSFGVLSKTEWNNLFYKHLDHHLSQFGS